MQKSGASPSAVLKRRGLIALVLCSVAASLMVGSFAAMAPSGRRANVDANPDAALAPAPGNWAIVSSPNGGGPASAAYTNVLNAVSCTSTADCWAVGYSVPTVTGQTLIEHWDGSSWTVVTSPNKSITQAASNILYGVTCSSATECWAVGYYADEGVNSAWHTLIEKWDGTAWIIVDSPDVTSTGTNILNAVTCTSSSDCWAVGSYAAGGAGGTLVERWDGNSWMIVNSPSTSANFNYLNAVICMSASDCWAVGDYYTGSNFGTVIERWDGNIWSLVSSPNGDTNYMQNFLYGVACPSSSDCWAVGYYNTFYGQELYERWDGDSWNVVSPVNNNPAVNYQLQGIICTNPSECWAVGYISSLNNPRQTLIERWDGTSWSLVPSPTPSGGGYLTSVTCLSQWECWAVGFSGGSGNGVNAQTLIEHYTAPRLLSVVSRKTHGAAGSFNIDLPQTGPPAIECRTGGATGDFIMVFTFPDNLVAVSSANVSKGTGSVRSAAVGPNPNQYTVNLTGVTDAQYITVTVNGVLDSKLVSGTVSGTMGVLLGDVNGSGVVTSGDTNLCKAQALQPVTNANFRCDINASGSITTGDVNLIKENALTQLSSSP